MGKFKDWSSFAADFEKRSAFVVGQSDLDIVGRELSRLDKFGKVLELGCGTGVYTGLLAARADSVLATDISPEMVKVTTGKYKNLGNVNVERADCFDLTCSDETFDTVFMANLLHIVPEPEKIVAGVRRVLKRGGRIIISSLTVHGMKFSHKVGMGFRYLKTWGKPPKGGSVLTVENVTEMMEKGGFKVRCGRLIGDRSKSVFLIAERKI